MKDQRYLLEYLNCYVDHNIERTENENRLLKQFIVEGDTVRMPPFERVRKKLGKSKFALKNLCTRLLTRKILIPSNSKYMGSGSYFIKMRGMAKPTYGIGYGKNVYKRLKQQDSIQRVPFDIVAVFVEPQFEYKGRFGMNARMFEKAFKEEFKRFNAKPLNDSSETYYFNQETFEKAFNRLKELLFEWASSYESLRIKDGKEYYKKITAKQARKAIEHCVLT